MTDTADPPRPAGAGDDPVELSLQRFLAERTQAEWTPEQDIFADGGVSSLFALQLVVLPGAGVRRRGQPATS